LSASLVLLDSSEFLIISRLLEIHLTRPRRIVILNFVIFTASIKRDRRRGPPFDEGGVKSH